MVLSVCDCTKQATIHHAGTLVKLKKEQVHESAATAASNQLTCPAVGEAWKYR